MVLQYVLGAVDLLAACSLALMVISYPVYVIQAAAGLFLVVKGVIFIDDILSILDILIGVVMFVLIWVQAPVLALVLVIYLVVKALSTFV